MVLGVDVGGTKVAVAAVEGVTATRTREHPTVTVSADALLDGVEHVVRDVIADAGRPDAIGVGVPSQIEFATGKVETSVNIPLTGVPLREELGRRFGVPVYVDNDANCAALAEAHIVGARNLVMLTLGTGVGGGIVIGGRTFRGAHGLGAELGHMTINPDGPPCPGNCPNHGCLEVMASGTALVRYASLAVSRRPDTELGLALEEGRELTGPLITELAERGDPVARDAFTAIGRNLGVGLANVVNIFNPSVIVIGGGVIGAGELLLEPARAEMLARALAPGRDQVQVVAAAYGQDAGMVGAAIFAREEAGLAAPGLVEAA